MVIFDDVFFLGLNQFVHLLLPFSNFGLISIFFQYFRGKSYA